MRKLRYILVDVFTDQVFGGNQLAVFPNGRGIPDAAMQHIARELNLSECTFILPPDDPAHDYRVRIFTPASELPMAGHPTIGTAFVLAVEQMINTAEAQTQIILEEGIGPVPVTVDFKDGQPVMAKMRQLLPTFMGQVEDRQLVAEVLSLQTDDLLDTYPLEIISCGVPYLMIPLKDLRAIQNIKLRLDLYERLINGLPANALFIFTPQTLLPTSTVHARMFAPEIGIVEDPATGSACGPLGSYLVKYGLARAGKLIAEQGFEIGRKSLIHIEIEGTPDAITAVYVGGQAVFVGEGFLEV